MRHRLFNLLVAISTLLFVVTVVLWWISCFRYEQIYYRTAVNARLQQTDWIVDVVAGRLIFDKATDHLTRSPQERPATGWHTSSQRRPSTPFSHMVTYYRSSFSLDFSIHRKTFPATGFGVPATLDLFTIHLPLWAIALFFGLLPGYWLVFGLRRDREQRRRKRLGLCRKCGYDLRGTPDRCPECGTVPENVRT